MYISDSQLVLLQDPDFTLDVKYHICELYKYKSALQVKHWNLLILLWTAIGLYAQLLNDIGWIRKCTFFFFLNKSWISNESWFLPPIIHCTKHIVFGTNHEFILIAYEPVFYCSLYRIFIFFHGFVRMRLRACHTVYAG